MSSQPAEHIVSWLKSFSRVASGFSVLVGGAVLVGWALDSAVLVGVAPTNVAMNPLTALSFILAGCSLWLVAVPTIPEPRKLSRQRLAQACAGAVLLAGLLRLSEIVFGWRLGVDQILFLEKLAAAPSGWPSRMAPNTALTFVILGLALLLLDVETRRGRRPAQYLALGAAFVALLAVVGYAYGVAYLYGFAPFIPMALNTAVVFLTLSLGVLCARPDRGLMALFVSTGAGGSVVRWLLPAAIVVPVLFGWLRWEGERRGFYGTSFGVALFTTAMVLVLAFLVWRSALPLERVDEHRQQAQSELIRARDELKILNQSLEEKVEQRTGALRAEIAERQRAEEALGTSERKFRQLVESAADAIVANDAEGRILLANAQTETLFGYSREELLGQPLEILVPERFREAHRRGCAAFFADPNTQRMQGVTNLGGRHKDGREFPVEITLSPLETAEGLLVISIIRDVTERQRAAETLEASERKFRDLVECSPDGLVGVDARARIALVNAQAEKLFGYSREEMVGQPIEILVPERFREAHVGHRTGYLAVPQSRPMGGNLELYGQRKDGSQFPVEISLSPLETKEGLLVTAVVRDITERKQAEQETKRLFTLSLDLLCVAGFDGYFKRLNPAWEKTLGFTIADLLEKPYREFVHPDDRATTVTEADKLAEGASLISFENRYRCKDGSYRWLQWTAYPIPEENLIYAAARDITERKRAEESLKTLNRALELRTEELTGVNKELEAFTYSVSHDLRAPLRHIDGFSKLLLEGHSAGLSEEAQHYLHRVREGTQQMGQLVDDLLNLARVGRQSLKPQVTGLNSLVETVLAQLQPEIRSRTIEWQIGQLPFVECDPSLMKQVFQNLLSNAVKFTRPRQPAVIEVNQTTQNGHPVVYVRDNGVGFSMKYADKLFGVFQRLHRQEDFEGTGVGLATVQRILHKHGGRIWAEAELDKGATFYFTVGTAEENEAESRPLATARGEP